MVEKCMKSWKKFCPDWEIKCWDETNLNLDINTYCRQAYDAKKYAFASDVLRFDILKKHGGVYLDVDVELLKPLDNLLDQTAFAGFEMGDTLFVAPGLIFASEKNGAVVSDICEIYEKDSFLNKDNSFNCETVCVKVTNLLVDKYGLKTENTKQELKEITIYPTEYFCPLNASTKECDYLTENTYSKHLYLASWVPKPSFKQRIVKVVKKCIRTILGKKNYAKLKNKLKGNKNG